ncbi:MAG: hypothetical protein HY241_14995 [Actinobacteria bacterium]|nr:hypothetical protein [Actinomycetota bacterium]
MTVPARATLLATFLARVDWPKVSTVDTRRYGPQYLTTAEAERLVWGLFVDRLPVLHAETMGGLRLVVVGKSVTWSDRDLNVYVGTLDRPVRSFLDFTAVEFAAVFGWHLRVARRVAAALGADVYVTHGFNPDDISPDAHSLASKFHTHLHVPQAHGRRPVTPARLTHFERLSLVEPYAGVFYDRAAAFLTTRGGGVWRVVPGFGYVSLTAPLAYAASPAGLAVLHGLLGDLHAGYRLVVDAVTAGAEETATGCARLVPRLAGERQARMADLLTANAGWLSDPSAGLLTYLAAHVAPAEPREHPRSIRIASAGQAWLAKGLSGALNLVVSAATGRVRFDIAPRVVSTSGAAKVISPLGPTLVVKDQGPATLVQRRRMADFHATVAAVAATGRRARTDG